MNSKVLSKMIFIIILLNCFSSCEIEECKQGHRLDQGSCQCVRQLRRFCGKRCPRRRFLNSECKCLSRKKCGISECSFGFQLNFDFCECEPEIGFSEECHVSKCFDGFDLNDECECVDQKLFKCFKLCPKGKTIYPGTCKCTTIRKCHIEECNDPASLNNRCECEMPQDYCDIECPPNTEWEFPCQCVPKPTIEPEPPIDCMITECKPGLTLDEQSCKCVELPGPICLIGCPRGTRAYGGVCQCIKPYDCGVKSCKSPAVPNFDCDCEMPQDYCDIECPPNTQWEFPCQCIPKPIIEPPKIDECLIFECRIGFELDNNKCSCVERNAPVCYMMCPPGLIIYPGTCKCVEPYKCNIKNCKSFGIITSDCKCQLE